MFNATINSEVDYNGQVELVSLSEGEEYTSEMIDQFREGAAPVEMGWDNETFSNIEITVRHSDGTEVARIETDENYVWFRAKNGDGLVLEFWNSKKALHVSGFSNGRQTIELV